MQSLIDQSPSWNFFAFADVSRKHRNANFCCISEALSFFLAFFHRHNELFFSYLWSFICKFTSSEEIRILADEERTPTSCSIIIDLRLSMLFMLRCMRSFKVKSL